MSNTVHSNLSAAATVAQVDNELRRAGLPSYSELISSMKSNRQYLRSKRFDPGARDGVAFALESLLLRAEPASASAPTWTVRDLHEAHPEDHAFGTFDVAVHKDGKTLAYSQELLTSRKEAEAALTAMKAKGVDNCLESGDLVRAGEGEPPQSV